MKEIPLNTLDAEQLGKLGNSLNLFHKDFLDVTKVDHKTLLIIDNEYQFLEANEGSLFLMLPTQVILKRRENQA